MGRLLFLGLWYGGAFLVLRALWPELLRGPRRAAFLSLLALAVLVWAVPMALGLESTHPWPGPVLKSYAIGWSIASVVVVLLGLPVLLVRRWVLRASPPPVGQGGAEGSVAAPVPAVDMGRRNLLMNMGRSVPVVAVGTSSAGLAGGATGFKVLHEEVRLKGLPPALEGFRIGQLTDVHVGPFIDTDYLRRAVETLNAAKVDLQVMTGDLIDDLEQLDGTMAALGACSAPHGMLAVLGNHDHWRGAGAIAEGFEALAQVRLLVNESHVLEHRGQRVRVVGLDYPMGARRAEPRHARLREFAEVAFQGASPQDEVLLCLSHHPDGFPHAAERGARLTLAGHTHGGQVALLGVKVFGFAFEYMLGRYQRGEHHLYVSGGTGHWLPYRLGVPAEVTVLTLRAA